MEESKSKKTKNEVGGNENSGKTMKLTCCVSSCGKKSGKGSSKSERVSR